MIVQDCFRRPLLDNPKAKLQENKYSLSINSSPISGDNICAMKVRYLDQQINNEDNKLIHLFKIE